MDKSLYNFLLLLVVETTHLLRKLKFEMTNCVLLSA